MTQITRIVLMICYTHTYTNRQTHHTLIRTQAFICTHQHAYTYEHIPIHILHTPHIHAHTFVNTLAACTRTA